MYLKFNLALFLFICLQLQSIFATIPKVNETLLKEVEDERIRAGFYEPIVYAKRPPPSPQFDYYGAPIPKQIWRTLEKSEFLDYKKEKLEDLEKFGEEKCACGKHLLREMQKIRYGNDGWHFRVWPEPLGHGGTAEVFHAHLMSKNLKDFDGKPIKLDKKCVAIKSVLLEKAGPSMEMELRNELAILEKFARMEAKRVVRLFSIKEIPAKRQLLFALELGWYNFEMALKDLQFEWKGLKHYSVEELMQEKVMEILEAIKEMHKLAMHLDLKPANMLYVDQPYVNGGFNPPLLKVIDFGGSLLIPSEMEPNKDTRKRADVCQLKDSNWGTEIYRSPEHVNYCKKMLPNERKFEYSIKSDIWAVGVILLRLLLRTPTLVPAIGKYENDFVDSAMRFYKGMPDSEKRINSSFFYRQLVSTARQEYSRFFDLIMATFNKDPRRRPTARGMIKFLEGKCRLELPESEEILLNKQQQMFYRQQIGRDKTKFGAQICDTKTTGSSTSLLSNESSSEGNAENVVKINRETAIKPFDSKSSFRG